MPPDATALDMPAKPAMTADILPGAEGPALSATSDMPEVKAEPPPISAEVNTITAKSEPEAAEAGDAEANTPEADEPDPEAVPESGEVAPPVKEAKGVGKKLAALEAEKAALTRRAEIAEAERRTALAAIEQLSAKPTPTDTTPVAPRPERKAFDTPEAYDSALIEWASNETAAKTEAKLSAQQAAAKKVADDAAIVADHNRKAATWNEQRTAAIEKYPDFADVAESDAVTITFPMRDAIFGSENGTDVAYYLGQNPAEAAKIAALPMVNQIYEIGRISARLAVPAPIKVTKTPAPVKPIGARSSAGPKALSEMSMDEYAATRQQALNAERKPFVPAGVTVTGRPN